MRKKFGVHLVASPPTFNTIDVVLLSATTIGAYHDKWMTIVFWVGLLLALVITSYFAWQLVVLTRTLSSLNLTFAQNVAEESIDRADILNLVAVAILGVTLLLTWRRFAEMSLDILQAFAANESPFEELLVYPLKYVYDKEADRDEELDPYQAQNSTVGSVLRLLGFVWLIILLTPPVIYILTKATT